MRAIIGWLGSHTLVIFAVFILIALFFWLLRFHRRLGITWQEALAVSSAHVVIGWSCMKLLAIAEVGGNLDEAANIRIYGAVFTLPLLYYLWAKYTGKSKALVMDIAAICVVLGATSGRLHCVTTANCCGGVPIISGRDFCWPIRELELIYYLVFCWYYIKRIQQGKTHGEVYPIYMITYGVLRFMCEFVREEHTGQIGVFHLAHIWSLISIAAGIIAYYFVEKNNGSGASRRKKAWMKVSTRKGGKRNGSTA